MSPFLRIGLSNFDCGSCQPCQGEAVNPYCAVLVKEYVESGKREGVLGVGEEEEDSAMNHEARPSRIFLQFGKLTPREAKNLLSHVGLVTALNRPRAPRVLFHGTILPHKQGEQRKGKMG